VKVNAIILPGKLKEVTPPSTTRGGKGKEAVHSHILSSEKRLAKVRGEKTRVGRGDESTSLTFSCSRKGGEPRRQSERHQGKKKGRGRVAVA